MMMLMMMVQRNGMRECKAPDMATTKTLRASLVTIREGACGDCKTKTLKQALASKAPARARLKGCCSTPAMVRVWSVETPRIYLPT